MLITELMVKPANPTHPGEPLLLKEHESSGSTARTLSTSAAALLSCNLAVLLSPQLVLENIPKVLPLLGQYVQGNGETLANESSWDSVTSASQARPYPLSDQFTPFNAV